MMLKSIVLYVYCIRKKVGLSAKEKKSKNDSEQVLWRKGEKDCKYTLNYFFKANISSNILYLLYNGSINLIIKRCLVIKTRNYVSYLLTDWR